MQDQHVHPTHATHEHHMDHQPAAQHNTHTDHSAHAGGMHEGHATLMRDRFWLCLVLTIPVLLYSDTLQMLLGFTPPALPFMEWIPPIFSTLIFIFGGL